MPIYESRTHRMQNTALIEQRSYATMRVVRAFSVLVAGLGMFFLGLLTDAYTAGWWLLYAVSMAAIGYGWLGIILWVPLARQPLETDEIVQTMQDNTSPGAARLYVQDAPRHLTVEDIGIKNYERLALGYTFERSGWKWRRDPVFAAAGVRNYSARFASISEKVQKAGMIDAHGMIRQEFRAWWTSPTPTIVDVSGIDGSDDDPSSRR